MKLKFFIQYNTEWGQELHVVVSYYENNGRKKTSDYVMQTEDGSLWTMEISVVESRQHPVKSLSYFYQMEDGTGRMLRREWTIIERNYDYDSSKDYIFHDLWRDAPLQCHLFSKAYATTTGRNDSCARDCASRSVALPLFRKTVVFRVSAPQLNRGESLALCGNHPSLGDWNPARYLKMKREGTSDWILSVNIDGMSFPLEYKYVIIDDETNQLKSWEEGDNRVVPDYRLDDGNVLVLYGECLRVKESMWKAAGVVVPVFSLRSAHSYGVGDFGDLQRMVDWAVATGMKMIQILPVCDTTSTHTWTDSHPYNIISVHALHPHYLDLEQLPPLKDLSRMMAFNRQRRELNALNYSDYMSVDNVKRAYVDDIFAQEGETTLQSEPYQSFIDANEEWLMPYAAFCVLRDKYHTSRTSDWQDCSAYSREAVERICGAGSPYHAQVNRILFVQYHLYLQFRSACDYAHAHGISIVGDLPIGVYRDSVETWTHPEYFHLDRQTGAPPDKDMPLGQNWGFPTYDWSAMERSGFAWWHRRFAYMEQFYDVVRIDNMIGYFRAWEIPVGALFANMGHYSPSLPLSEDEICRYGLHFRKEMFTRPFISDKVIGKIFGIHAEYVRHHFLISKSYGMYSLKPEYDTQEKVRSYFDGKHDENSLWIRDGLYKLIANVLFIEDEENSGMYHPRFGAYNEPVYEILDDEDKDAFMRLYNNYFFVRHNDFWSRHAVKKLSAMLASTRMLVFAEDLGLLPDSVASVLDSMRILSLEIQSMPKIHGMEFAHLESNPYRSVATISTHDTPPLRLWWEESPGRTQRYYATMLQKEGIAPRHLPAFIAEEIIARHLYCPSMLCLLALQDWLAMSAELRSKDDDIPYERINSPYDSYNQWKYRMNMNIEQLMEADMFNKKIGTMIKRSRR